MGYGVRLEYAVAELSEKLGVDFEMAIDEATAGLDKESRISLLEEVLPYLERQWSSASRNALTATLLGAAPPEEDALSSSQRLELIIALSGRTNAAKSELSSFALPGEAGASLPDAVLNLAAPASEADAHGAGVW